MIKEKSSGAIIFRKEGGKIYYLLLSYGKNYWGFSKGHVEKGESEEEAAQREIEEETGIKKIEFIKGFKERIAYFFKRMTVDKNKKTLVFKEVIFYLGKTNTKNIKISSEHKGFKWLPYNLAIKKTTFKNAKKILKKANNFLLNYYGKIW